MSQQAFLITARPEFVGVGDYAQMTVHNIGAVAVYYSNSQNVSPSVNVGSIAAGAVAVISAGQYFVTAAGSTTVAASAFIANAPGQTGAAGEGTTTLLPFSIPGPLTVAVGTARLYLPVTGSIVSVEASVGTAPTGSSVVVDVNLNGATIFSGAKPTITTGSFTSGEQTPATTAFGEGDYLTVDVDQVGSTLPGEDLTVVVWTGSEPVLPGNQSPGVTGSRMPRPITDTNRGFTMVDPGGASLYNAFPGVVKAGAGHGIIAHRRATSHDTTVGTIYISRSDANWQNWSTPAQLLTVASRDLRTARLSRLSDGRIALAGFASNADSSPRLHSEFVIYSSDDGATFPYDATAIAAGAGPDQFTLYCACEGRIVDLGGGVLLWPVYGLNTGGTLWTNAVLKSTDNGVTWPTQITVHAGASGNSFAELNLVVCADGSILAASRNLIDLTIWFARSTNAGASWTNLGSMLDGTNRPDMLLTSYGRLYLTTRRPTGERPILYYSDDHGATWVPDPLGAFGLAGLTLDTRYKADGATAVISNGAPMAEPFPGLVASVSSVEAGAAGAEVGIRWITERSAVAPSGQKYGGHIFDGQWDGDLLAIKGTYTYPWYFMVDASNRVGMVPGSPRSSTDSNLVLLGIERRRITFIANPLTITNIPGGETEVSGTLALADLTGMSTYRLSANTIVGFAGATLKVQYSIDNGANWPDLTATISIASVSLRRIPAADPWSSIPVAARGQILARVVSTNGDGAADPIVSQVVLEARAVA